jgi:hypothetical protein
VLVARAGHVVEKEDVLKEVWPGTFVEEATLAQNISTLRKALGDTSENPRYIATSPRRGYRFIETVIADDIKAVELAASRPATAITRRALGLRSWVALAAVVGLGVAYYGRARPSERPAASEWHINPPPGTTLMSGGVLSPDARSIAFVTIDEWGTTALWVQRLASLDQLRLPGTEHARAPIWSPDGNAIVFTAAGKLKRIDLSDKMPHTLADATVPHFQDHGGAWNSGNLLCSMNERGPIYKSKPDGTFEVSTRLEAWERAHLWPSFLPDGRHFLYEPPHSTLSARARTWARSTRPTRGRAWMVSTRLRCTHRPVIFCSCARARSWRRHSTASDT